LKSELLQAAVQAQADKRAIVLVRSLDSPDRWIVDPAREAAFSAGLPDALREASIAALKRDGVSVIEADGRSYLLQTLSPPYRLIVIGAVHIAQALIPMAIAAGYSTVLIDPRPAFATPERFAGIEILNAWPQDVMAELALTSRSAVVTLSHDPKIDEPALAGALRSEAFFIGALGSRRNHAGRLERLTALGFDAQALARVTGPVGLDLGGRAPAEIAVAILAQIINVRYRGSGAIES
jgi:xanthine dehydrogenase accessory factor